ncbi:MAG: hypothetical protein IPM47_11220 [Sphingobacteriales bacterium]|nr:MAG: hypothetical protein IPM47_11220 [Sphingobacteriales bacterium]
MILSFDILKQATPIKQFVIVLLVTGILMLLCQLFCENPEMVWFIAVSSLGFYVWANAVLGFFSKSSRLVYVIQSFLLFCVMAFLIIKAASYLSGQTLNSLREYQIMVLATFVFHIGGIIVCTIIKNVAELMEINY